MCFSISQTEWCSFLLGSLSDRHISDWVWKCPLNSMATFNFIIDEKEYIRNSFVLQMAWEESPIDKNKVYERHKCFHKSRESVDDYRSFCLYMTDQWSLRGTNKRNCERRKTPKLRKYLLSCADYGRKSLLHLEVFLETRRNDQKLVCSTLDGDSTYAILLNSIVTGNESWGSCTTGAKKKSC